MLRLLRKESPRGSDVAHFDVSYAGETYWVKLKRSAAARRFILRFRAATQDVVLTIPARAKLIDAKAFAEGQAPWIGSRLRWWGHRTICSKSYAKQNPEGFHTLSRTDVWA